MSTLREAAQQALDALYDIDATGVPVGHIDAVIDSLKAALEQPEPEPVAWRRVHPFDYGIGHEGVYAMTQRLDQVKAWERKGWTVQPLYTHPPRREWQGLTEEEIYPLYSEPSSDAEMVEFARAIEQALRSKNHE